MATNLAGVAAGAVPPRHRLTPPRYAGHPLIRDQSEALAAEVSVDLIGLLKEVRDVLFRRLHDP